MLESELDDLIVSHQQSHSPAHNHEGMDSWMSIVFPEEFGDDVGFVDEAPLNNDGAGLARLVEEYTSHEEFTHFLNFMEDERHVNYIPTICPALYELAKICQSDEAITGRILLFCRRRLLTFEKSRLVRKFATSIVRWLTVESKSYVRENIVTDGGHLEAWNEWLVLLDGLEEPQFHLITPLLPKVDKLVVYLETKFGSVSSTTDGDDSILPVGHFSFHWLRLVFQKAIQHTNGWIRLWAIQKVVDIPAHLISADSTFIIDVFLPALNTNDPFARLIEKDELHQFLEQASLMFSLVTQKLDAGTKMSFYAELIKVFTRHWTPCPLFYVSYTLTRLEPHPVFTIADFSMFRNLLNRVSEMQYMPLKLMSLFNFYQVLFRLTCWSEDVIWCLPQLLYTCSQQYPNLFHAVFDDLFRNVLGRPDQALMFGDDWEALIEQYLTIENYGGDVDPDETAQLSKTMDAADLERGLAKGAYAPTVWLLALTMGIADELLVRMESLFVDFTEKLLYEKADLLLLLWIERPKCVKSDIKAFIDIVRAYLTMRAFSLNSASAKACRNIMETVIVPTIHHLNRTTEFTETDNYEMALCIFVFVEEAKKKYFEEDVVVLAKDQEAVLCLMAAECLKSVNRLNVSRVERFVVRIAAEVFHKPHLSGGEESNSSEGCRLSSVSSRIQAEKDSFQDTAVDSSAPKNQKISRGHALSSTEYLRLQKLRLLLVVLQRLDADAMEGLVGERLVTEDCPTVASVVVLLSTWLTFATCEERELIMSLLQMMTSLKSIKLNADSKGNLLQALVVTVSNQMKTRNYVPTVRSALQIMLQRSVVDVDRTDADNILGKILDLIHRFVDQSALNPSLAVVVAESVFGARHLVRLDDHRWSDALLRLAIFGPISKKATETLTAAYRMAYESASDRRMDVERANSGYGLVKLEFSDSCAEMLHLVNKCARLNALSTIMFLTRLLSLNESEETIFVKRILEMSDDINASKTRSFGLSVSHRQSTRLMQILLLVVDRLKTKEALNSVFNFCVKCLLDTSQQASIKLLIEWIVLRICVVRRDYFDQFLSLESVLAKTRIGSVSSWLNVVQHYYYQASKSTTADERFARILPWCTAQNFAVRCSAIAALRRLWYQLFPCDGSGGGGEDGESTSTSDWGVMDIKADGDDASSSVGGGGGGEGDESCGAVGSFSDAGLAVVKSVVEFELDMSTGNANRVIKCLCNDFYFGNFSPSDNFDLETILRIFPSKTGLPENEQLDATLLRRYFTENFSDEELTRLPPIGCTDRKFAEAESLVFSNLSKNHNTCPSAVDRRVEDGGDGNESNDLAGDEMSVQRKYDSSKSSRRSKNAQDASMVVVASLVTKPANLGGLCRTCEIFGVNSLVVSNSAVIDDAEFKALSMSAENWTNIEQVKPDDLKTYLRVRRAEGYRIVAAEQTTHSIPLERFRFPDRCVVLLGDEKEGVPVDLIRYVDDQVEITQLGRTRSLNVHVSAALFIHQFAVQQLLEGNETTVDDCTTSTIVKEAVALGLEELIDFDGGDST